MLQTQDRRDSQRNDRKFHRIVNDSIMATQDDTESVQGHVELTEEAK